MGREIWLKSYPKGTPAEIDPDRYDSILDVLGTACRRFHDRPAYTNMGVTLTFADLDRLSRDFAAFLTHELGLKPGDRVGLQMPNVLQYPVAMFGALRAGMVVVNTNPLYTAREMEHQYRDAGVKAIVILANFAKNLEEVWTGERYVALRKTLVEEQLFPVCRRCCKVELSAEPAGAPAAVPAEPEMATLGAN